MDLCPDDPLRCLLIHTEFSKYSYWNYKIACEIQGVKTPSPPLGLLTVAALLPQNWRFKLLDLNTRGFSQEDWEWADVICVGGMLPQQEGMIEVIQRAKQDGKYIVVGGADPSSQPDTYESADTIVIGEGEVSIPLWLDAWRKGSPYGRFEAKEKPDVTQSPVPMYELLNLDDYLLIGVQYSRGCPFNCEFCDIIELFGRKPRIKTPEQLLKELDKLYELGHRGAVDLVDDNFIGNKRKVKRELLPALIEWNRKRGYPFYFNTEASMNLADDKKLLRQMRAADFRYIFMGIESPDPDILMQTQKSQNTMKPVVDRVNVLYEYGMFVTAGFIIGFDSEKKGTDKALIKCIEDANICMAMVGLLTALPNTQLTRRLKAEGRLTDFRGVLVESNAPESLVANCPFDVVDQTTGGLNFITKRDRVEVLQEYLNVVKTIYNPRIYMDRVLRVAKKTKVRPKYLPKGKKLWNDTRGLWRMCVLYSKQKHLRWLFWRNFFIALSYGPLKMDLAMRHMGIFLHYDQQTRHVEKTITEQIKLAKALKRWCKNQEKEEALMASTNIAANYGGVELPASL